MNRRSIETKGGTIYIAATTSPMGSTSISMAPTAIDANMPWFRAEVYRASFDGTDEEMDEAYQAAVKATIDLARRMLAAL